MLLNKVHLGFDDSFNPTVVIIKRPLLAELPTSHGLEFKLSSILGSYWRFLCNAAYGPKIVLPGEISEDNWFNRIRCIGDRVVVLDCSRRILWAIKGDRNNGLNVSLGTRTGVKVRLEKVDTTKGIVWDFWMELEQKQL
jgi:hypothetical protein